MTTIAHFRRSFLAWVFGFIATAAGVRGVEVAVNPVRSDVVLAWNDVLIDTTWAAHDVQPDSGATAFLLAVMPGAMDESIESSAGDATAIAASASAAHAVLMTLLPEHSATWDRVLSDSLAEMSEKPDCADSALYGRRVASAWLERHGYSGAAAAASLASHESTPGWVHSAQPFRLRRPDQFRAEPPDLNTVIHAQIGARGRVSPAIFRAPLPDVRPVDRQFWSGPPEIIWNHIARDWSLAHAASLLYRARLFAVLNAAMADSFVSAHASRQYYRNGSWFFLIGTAAEALGGRGSPPEVRIHATLENYPWVASVVTGTAFEILRSFCGDDAQLVVIEPWLPSASPARTYDDLAQAAEAGALASAPDEIDLLQTGPASFQHGRKLGRWIAQQARPR